MQTRTLRARGMTLIEVLVGIVIGMVAMIAIFQVVTVWDSRTRASTSSGDAQIAGALAMFNLERDLKLAGMGFVEAGASLNCLVRGYDNVPNANADFNLRPVSITFNATGPNTPDTVEVLYGNSPYLDNRLGFSGGTVTSAQTEQKYGLKRGDLAVLTDRASGCNLVQITDDSGPDEYVVGFGTANYANYYSGTSVPPRWNNASRGQAQTPIATGDLFSLGPIPRRNLWQIQNGTLGFINTMSTIDVNQFFGVADSVIDLKAQYGYDNNNDKVIQDTEWTTTQPVDWTRLRAIRVALLIRGREFQKPPPTGATDTPTYTATTPTWSGGAFSTMKNVDGSADSNVAGDPNNWRYYRYRVYERVIPLRNMMWGAS